MEVQLEVERVPFALDPPERTLNFLGRAVKSISKDDPLAIKTTHYVLWTAVFFSIAFAMAGTTSLVVFPLYLTGLALLPFAYEVMQAHQHHVCKEFNVTLISTLGGQEKLDNIPEVDLPMGKIGNLRASVLTNEISKGMDSEKQPFLVIKREEYIDCLSRKVPDHWVLYHDIKDSEKKLNEMRIRRGDLTGIIPARSQSC